MAILNVIGQMGPLLGTRLYPDADRPYFVKGMAVCAVAMAIVFVLAAVLRHVLRNENRRRLSELADGAEESLVGGRQGRATFLYIT